MKKTNIKTQIRLGFFAVFAIMLLMVLYLIFQIRTISQNARLIYEHPYKVSNTIRDIKIELYKTARLVRDVRYAENNNELDNLINEINEGDNIINSNLKIVYDLYLGSINDIDSLKKSYTDWKEIRNSLYVLKKENKMDSVDYLLKNKNHIQVDYIVSHANKIADFAKNKAENTYTKTIKTENKTLSLSIVLLIVASLLVLFLVFYLSRNISKPVQTFVKDANIILSGQTEINTTKVYSEEELFGLTLEELKKSYQNIEQQNEEIKSMNEQLSNQNISLEEKVKQRTTELQSTNEQLLDEKAFTEAIIESIHGMLYVYDEHGTHIRHNKKHEEMTGYSSEELYSMNPLSWYDDKSDIIRVESAINDVFSKGYGEVEVPMRIKNGEKLQMFFNGSKLVMNDKKYFVGVGIDITERKQSEVALKESEEKFRNIFENAPIGNSLTTIDGTININQTFADMIGYSKQELKEIKWQKITHPDDIEITQQNMDMLIKGERESVRFLKRYIHKNNSIIWTDVSSFIQKDKTGKSLYFVTAIINITERKLAELQLIEKELAKTNLLEKLNEAQQIAMIGSWEWDLITNKVWWSDETYKIFGVDPLNFIPSFEANGNYIHPDDIENYKKSFEHCLQTGEKLTFNTRIIADDGQLKYCFALGTIFYDDTHKPIRFVGTIMDITKNKQAEEALKKSEEKFKAIFENNMVAACCFDQVVYENGIAVDYRILDINPAYEKILSISRKDVVGKLASDVYKTKDIPFLDIYAKVAETGVPAAFESYFPPAGIYLQITASRPSPGMFSTIFADITERKKMENALIQNEAHLNTLIDTIPDLIWLKDGNGVYMHCNKRFESFFGATKEEIIGKTDYDFVNKELADFFRENDKIAIAAGKPSLNEEEVSFANDGHSEILETIKTPVYKSGNQIIGVLGIGRNITERKKAENELRESERKLREAQEMAHLGFWSLNVKTGEVEWSEEVFKIFGLEPESFTPQIDSILALSPWPEDHERDKEIINRALESHDPGSYEQKFFRPDKSIGHYYSTFQGVYNKNNELISIIGTVLDITERKIAQEAIIKLNETLEQKVKIRTAQLEASYAEMEAFSYSVSHDLRSPLRAINGFSKILLENTEKLDAETIRLLNKVSDNSQNMSKLIEDLITYAKVGKVNISHSPVNMKELVKSVISSYKKEITSQKIAFNVSKLPEVSGDPVLFSQIWTNLIRNAIKFTSKTDNAEVTIGSKEENKEIIYFIKDNGVGFDMKYINKIFKVFERLHTSEDFEGTGIGLAIVKKAVSMHGGRVWAESKEGEGAAFYFAIPVIG